MSCNIYEEPRLNLKLAERQQADSGEWLERPVEIYESADGLVVCHTVPNRGGASVEKPLPGGQRKKFSPALLLLVLLSLVLLLSVVILSALYVSVALGRDKAAQSLQRDQHQDEHWRDQILCRQGGNSTAGSHIGWRRFRCNCYYKSEGQKNWTESRKECQRSGGDLVSITTIEKKEFVKAMNGKSSSWIGLSLNKWSDWEWVDGTMLSSSSWRAGWKKEASKSKVFINQEGLWDTTSTGTKHWICERPV